MFISRHPTSKLLINSKRHKIADENVYKIADKLLIWKRRLRTEAVNPEHTKKNQTSGYR